MLCPAATSLIASMTPEDMIAGAELAAEAVTDAVDKAVAEVSSMTPEDVQAGVELAAEAVADAIDAVRYACMDDALRGA